MMIYYLFYRVYKRTFAIMALAKSVGGFFCPKTAHFLVCEPIPAQWQEKKNRYFIVISAALAILTSGVGNRFCSEQELPKS